LFDFARVSLAPGASTLVTLSIPPSVIAHVDQWGDQSIQPGEYAIQIGGGLERGDDAPALEATLRVSGPAKTLFSLSSIKAKHATKRE
jgi:hypothetical protein